MNTIEVVTAYGPSGAIGDKFPAIRLNDFLDWSNKREADIRELNDRLVERQESFQAQLIRIEDTWREKLAEAQKAQIPICIGRPIIEILAAEGIWTSTNGNSVVAADDLFQNSPYQK